MSYMPRKLAKDKPIRSLGKGLSLFDVIEVLLYPIPSRTNLDLPPAFLLVPTYTPLPNRIIRSGFGVRQII
jgi:hypothetical protein